MVRLSVIDLAALANSVTDDNGETVFYHKGGDAKKRNRDRLRQRAGSARADALVIAWDGEGINLRGNGMPQSYVLFGCSAEPDSPVILNDPMGRLDHKLLFKYICDIGSRYPGAIHVGYSFKYDQNMLIQTMPLSWKIRLKDGKWVSWNDGGYKYRLKITWGKRTHIIRECANARVSVRIDDIFPSFHSSFVSAYERYFPNRNENWGIVVEGKQRRNINGWEHLNAIAYYWRAEILAMAELGTLYRDLLYSGGMEVSDFYGPGPIASFIRKRFGLLDHEWGAKEANIPSIVHEAARGAFFGGRFEQFSVGRIDGPIYSIDINSAYPFALCNIPSLDSSGYWREVDSPSHSTDTFGCYYVRYRHEQWINAYSAPLRCPDAQPLPFRDSNGMISYPAITEGWYWRPEVQAVMDIHPDRIEIIRGVEWIPGNALKPWQECISFMYRERQALKAQKSPLEMVYKLGINSLYGKYAQRVGWNPETKTPPSSHALSIAGYVTSTCRAMLYRVMAQLSVGDLIAVETDGIYTTANPVNLNLPTGIGKELGQWEAEEWDAALYVQNGVYWLAKDGEWKKAKSRGFSSTLVNPEAICEYLQSLMPNKSWPSFQAEQKVQSFIGIGSALQWARNSKGSITPTKAAILHCQWIEQSRELIPSGKGKRTHVPAQCNACRSGNNPYERPHSLVSNHGAFRGMDAAFGGKPRFEIWDCRSQPHRLPWECSSDYKWREKADSEIERIEIGIDAPTLSV